MAAEEVSLETFGEEWLQIWGQEISPFQARMLAAMDRRGKRFYEDQTAEETAVANRIFKAVTKKPGIPHSQLLFQLRRQYGPEIVTSVVEKLVNNDRLIMECSENDKWRTAVYFMKERNPAHRMSSGK